MNKAKMLGMSKNTYNIVINLLKFPRRSRQEVRVDATANGATGIRIHSPDTDVFILALRRCPDLCQNTLFVTGKADTYRIMKL